MLSKSADIQIRTEPHYQRVIKSPWNYFCCVLGRGGNTRMENVILITIAILYLCKQTETSVQI